MAFVDVSQRLQYKKFALWEKGDSITGRFTQLKNAGEYKGQTQWQAVLDVTDKPNFDDYKGNPIEVGSKFGLALSTAIADYFTEDTIGNLFKVEYLGKLPNKDNSNTYHAFKVLMDDGRSEDAPSSDESFEL